MDYPSNFSGPQLSYNAVDEYENKSDDDEDEDVYGARIGEFRGRGHPELIPK